MKTLIRSANPSAAKTLLTEIKPTSCVAYRLETTSDLNNLAREITTFIGKDIKPVTVIVVKGE